MRVIRRHPLWVIVSGHARRPPRRLSSGSGRASCRRWDPPPRPGAGVAADAVTRLGSLAAAAIAVVAVTTPGVAPSSSSVAADQHLTIAGESEVGSPWTPATLRCDSYCFVRARAVLRLGGGVRQRRAGPRDARRVDRPERRLHPVDDHGAPGDLVHRRDPRGRRRRHRQPAGDRGQRVAGDRPRRRRQGPGPRTPRSGDARHRQGRRHVAHRPHRRRRRPGAPAAVARLPAPARRSVGPHRLAAVAATPSPTTRRWRRRRSGPVRSSSTATSRTGRWRRTATRTTG